MLPPAICSTISAPQPILLMERSSRLSMRRRQSTTGGAGSATACDHERPDLTSISPSRFQHCVGVEMQGWRGSGRGETGDLKAVGGGLKQEDLQCGSACGRGKGENLVGEVRNTMGEAQGQISSM